MDKNQSLQLEMIAALPDPVFVLTESGRYAAMIGGLDRDFYHDGSCLVDFSLYDVLPEQKADWFLQQIRITLEENRLRVVEYVLAADQVQGLKTEDGPAGDIWFEGRVQPMPSPVNGERAVLWLASNISRRHALELKLQRLSETDELTGVYNRRKLIESLAERLDMGRREQAPPALIFLDVDHFKQVNDRYGHLIGDAVLRQIALVCAGELREPDVLARFGGEEFAILLPSASLDEAGQAADRIRERIETQVLTPTPGLQVSVTVSAGVCVARADDREVDDLIRRADSALYGAKRNGRNRTERFLECDDTGATTDPTLKRGAQRAGRRTRRPL